MAGGFGSPFVLGQLSRLGGIFRDGSGVVAGVGSIFGEGQTPAIPGCGNVTGIGVIVGEGTCTRSGSGPVGCVGTLAGTGYTSPAGIGLVVGIGSVVGVGSITTSGYNSVIGIGLVVGDGGPTLIEQTQHAIRFGRNDMRMLLRTHGESITYYPCSGDSRSIRALIERDVEIAGDTEQVAHAIVVRVLDHVSDGIRSQEINDGADEVGLRLKIGGLIQRRQITRRITSVAGVTRFLVR